MSLERFAYLAMLVFCLGTTLPLIPAFGLELGRTTCTCRPPPATQHSWCIDRAGYNGRIPPAGRAP